MKVQHIDFLTCYFCLKNLYSI